MGKVYLKTKYDNEMKMEIPHNHNFASAMFGFREMAAEIVPYHLISMMILSVKILPWIILISAMCCLTSLG